MANNVFPTAEIVLSNPKALWVMVQAKELQRVLSVIKKFNVDTICDLSHRTLKFTTVHPTKGFIQATLSTLSTLSNWPQELVIRTSFNIQPLQKYLYGSAFQDNHLILIHFTADYLQMFKNKNSSIVLGSVRVSAQYPYIKDQTILTVIEDQHHVLREVYNETEKNERIEIRTTENAVDHVIISSLKVLKVEPKFDAHYLVYLFKEQLSFFPAFTRLRKRQKYFGYALVTDKLLNFLYFKVIFLQDDIHIEIDIPFLVQSFLSFNEVPLPKEERKEEEKKEEVTEYLSYKEALQLVSETEPLVSTFVPTVSVKAPEGIITVDYLEKEASKDKAVIIDHNEETIIRSLEAIKEEKEEEKEEKYIECPRCQRGAAKMCSDSVIWCPVCDDWTKGKENFYTHIDWPSKERYIKQLMKKLYIFNSTPNFEHVYEVVKLNNLDPWNLTTDDIAYILRKKRKEEKSKKYTTKLEAVIILKALRKNTSIPGDAEEKVIYLMGQFLGYLFKKRRVSEVFKKSTSLDYFTYLYLFDEHFDINLGLVETAKKAIPEETREIFDDFMEYFIDEYNKRQLPGASKMERDVISCLRGQKLLCGRYKRKNHINSLFYEEEKASEGRRDCTPPTEEEIEEFNEKFEDMLHLPLAPWEEEGKASRMIIDPDFVEKLLLRDPSLSPEYIVVSFFYGEEAAKANEHRLERSDKIEWLKFMIECVEFYDKEHEQLKTLKRTRNTILERETLETQSCRKETQGNFIPLIKKENAPFDDYDAYDFDGYEPFDDFDAYDF